MNRVHTLSDDEVQALERLHRETNDADVRTRCDMILLSNEGLSPPKIGKRSRFTRYTVVRFVQRYEAEGLRGLYSRPRGGRPRRVTADYEAKLWLRWRKSPARWGCPSRTGPPPSWRRTWLSRPRL